MTVDNLIVTSTILIIFFLFSVRELFFIYKNIRRTNSAAHNVRSEKTRQYFANLRNRLMQMVFSNEMDTRSVSFQSLYQLYTAIMRRPDHYKEIGKLLFAVLALKEGSGNIGHIRLEDSDNVHEFKNLLKDTAEGIMMLIVDFSPLLRVFYTISNRLEKRSYFEFLAEPIKIIQEVIEKREEKQNSTYRSFNNARIELSNIAA